jgi:predicted Fe-Mo cluster-binding NifX family protein
MRIAVTTDQDFVSSCFGCTPDCTVIDIEAGRMLTFIPKPDDCRISDFLERNAVLCLIVGNIGANAKAVLKWRGVRVLSGVQGSLDDVVERYLDGTLAAHDGASTGPGCGLPPAGCGSLKTT